MYGFRLTKRGRHCWSDWQCSQTLVWSASASPIRTRLDVAVGDWWNFILWLLGKKTLGFVHPYCSAQPCRLLRTTACGGQDIPRRVAVFNLGPTSEPGSAPLPIASSQPLHTLQGPHRPRHCCRARRGCHSSCNTVPITDGTLGWMEQYAKVHTVLFCLHGSKMSLKRNVFILAFVTLPLLSACVGPVWCSGAKEINSEVRKT